MQPVPFSSLESFKESVALLDTLLEQDHFNENLLTPYKIRSLLEKKIDQIAKIFSESKVKNLSQILEEELCEMVLPTVLDGGGNYMNGMALRNESLGLPDNQEVLKEKFLILSQSRYITSYLPQLQTGYGFITYPGYMLIHSRDLLSRYPKNPEHYFEYAYPVIYEFEGLKKNEGEIPLPGWLAFFFVKPETMPNKVDLVRKKTLEAVKAIEKLNGKIIGLGGLSASLTKGGNLLEEKTSSKITTGHAYTISNIFNTLEDAAQQSALPLNRSIVAVVGAAGSVGRGAAIICARFGVQKLILFDRRPLDTTLEKIREVSEVPIEFGDIKEDIGKAHVVLVATSDPNVLFDAQDFQPGTLILDDSQPKNIGKEFMIQRDDIIVLEGGAVEPPAMDGYKIRPAFGPKLKSFHWGLVNLAMTGKTDVPSCLAEVMAWSALNENREEYSLGSADPELADYLNQKSVAMGFKPATLQCFGKSIPPERFAKVREINQARFS
jgi:fatty aldehyde-generating acyl-ACP reductase